LFNVRRERRTLIFKILEYINLYYFIAIIFFAFSRNIVLLSGFMVYPNRCLVNAAPPTTLELRFNSTLLAYSKENIPQESVEGILRRERDLDRMGTLCRDWIKSVCLQKGYPGDVAQTAGGQLFTSGSYRLGVHEPGAPLLVYKWCQGINDIENIYETSTKMEMVLLYSNPSLIIYTKRST
jgi:hypothetical protein